MRGVDGMTKHFTLNSFRKVPFFMCLGVWCSLGRVQADEGELHAAAGLIERVFDELSKDGFR